MNYLLTKLIEDHYGKSKEDFSFKYEEWCGEFLKHSLAQHVKQQHLKINDLHVAKKWLKVGLRVVQADFGDIVVLNRESLSSWKGHVGLFVRKFSKDQILVFGGNQSGKVCISNFNIQKIAGFRRIVC